MARINTLKSITHFAPQDYQCTSSPFTLGISSFQVPGGTQVSLTILENPVTQTTSCYASLLADLQMLAIQSSEHPTLLGLWNPGGEAPPQLGLVFCVVHVCVCVCVREREREREREGKINPLKPLSSE
jgi:hypothetical protein